MSNPLHPMLAALWREAAAPAQALAQTLAAQALLQPLGSALADLPLLGDPLAALTAWPLADGSRTSAGLHAVLAVLAGAASDDGVAGASSLAPGAGHPSRPAGAGGTAPAAANRVPASAAAPGSLPLPQAPGLRAALLAAGLGPVAQQVMPAMAAMGGKGSTSATGATADPAAAAAMAAWQDRLHRAGLDAAFVLPLALPGAAGSGDWPGAAATGLASAPRTAGAGVGATGPSRLKALAGQRVALPAATNHMAGQSETVAVDAMADAAVAAVGAGVRARSIAGRADTAPARAGTAALQAGMAGLGAMAFAGGIGGLRGLAARAAAATAALGPAGAAAAEGGASGVALAGAAGAGAVASTAMGGAGSGRAAPACDAVEAGAPSDEALLERLARALRREAERDGIDLGAVRG